MPIVKPIPSRCASLGIALSRLPPPLVLTCCFPIPVVGCWLVAPVPNGWLGSSTKANQQQNGLLPQCLQWSTATAGQTVAPAHSSNDS